MKKTVKAAKGKAAPKTKAKKAPIFTPKTFGQSLNQSEKLLALIDANSLTDRQMRTRVDKFMVNSDTVRGFCIVLLTGDYKASDNPPAAMVKSMRAGSPAVFEVMAKNVVMAPTMAVTHRRNKDAEAAAGSDRCTDRAIKLIHLIDSEDMTEQLHEMQKAFRGEESSFRPFVLNWKYLDDADQVKAGLDALESALKTS
jgi:hypothetical protein